MNVLDILYTDIPAILINTRTYYDNNVATIIQLQLLPDLEYNSSLIDLYNFMYCVLNLYQAVYYHDTCKN